MYRRWRESPWGRLWRGKEDSPNASHARWVLPNDAGSFQVGDFLGLDTYAKPAPRNLRLPTSSTNGPHTEEGPSTSRRVLYGDPSTRTDHTFVTALSHISPEPDTALPVPQSLSLIEESPVTTDDSDVPIATSSASLIRVVPAADRPPIRDRLLTVPNDEVPKLKPASSARALAPAMSDSAINGSTDTPRSFDRGKGKGKAKAKTVLVHVPHDPSPPAPPGEVLRRTGDEMQETSAGAAEESQVATTSSMSLDVPDEYDNAKMRDRMVVRVAYCKDDTFGLHFDEMQDRCARDMQYEDWAEFMVIWRGHRLELYNNFRLPGKEWVVGHKRLAFVVPLKGARTRLSLYSFTDMSFCIMCPPASLRAGVKILLPFRRKTGTNVFIFKPRCRSRAIDWIWRLWREMEGKLPSFIEVRSPVIETRLKIDIPECADGSFFCRDNLVALCIKTLSTVRDWEVIIKNRLAEGAHMELAWRLGTNLDWIWWHDDFHGHPRSWAVLAGLALNQAGRAAHLEVRLAEHTAPQLHIKDGSLISEPPSIEGYVTRVRAPSGTHEEVYLTVHNGFLFTLRRSHANAPNPPGAIPVPFDSNKDAAKVLREDEVRRGAKQVLAARDVTDLRAVVAVRRAFRPVFLPSQPEHDSMGPDSGVEEQDGEVTHEETDTQDVGGDAGLTGDVTTIRMRRCFELVMKTGHIMRFETWSARVAIEWIERLRALVHYWKQRHVVDTRHEMEVVQFATGRPRITPQRLRDEDDSHCPTEQPPNPAVTLPYLSSMYDWCVFEGCRPITRSGRIYVRRGHQDRFRLVELFLVAGQLVQFHIKPKSTHYRRQRNAVSLLDAYVVSGVLAAQVLPQGQYNPNNPITPRRYADGLESDDTEENMLFMVYYVSHKVAQAGKVPSLNAAKKMMVFRCRSRIERDVWCWALNTEIEKLARGKRDREEKWRNVGTPIPLR